MNPQLIEDPRAAKRSLMLAQKTLCNGEASGIQCKHYWAMTKKIDVPNPDHFHKGENIRYCLADASNATLLGNNGCDMMVYCTKYEKGSLPYDSKFEEYTPLSVEAVENLMSPEERADHEAEKARIIAEIDKAKQALPGAGIDGKTVVNLAASKSPKKKRFFGLL